jgi:hypothetical protein
LKEQLFGFFVFFSTGRCYTKVPSKVIIIEEVGLNGTKVNQSIIKLLQNDEALGHALSSWDGVALGG